MKQEGHKEKYKDATAHLSVYPNNVGVAVVVVVVAVVLVALGMVSFFFCAWDSFPGFSPNRLYLSERERVPGWVLSRI